MKRNLFLLAAALFAVSLFAITPFRHHRFDQFKALPVQDSAIVFFGNSITNMHEWWEALGSEQKVLNRGNSGATTPELIDNVGSVIALKPAKVFIGIGTNDLAYENLKHPDSIAARISELARLIKQGSPATEVYVQSILPSNNGKRTPEIIATTNAKIKQLVEAQGATFINLFDDMQEILTKELSYDNLHLNFKGYRIWLDKIAPYTGLKSIYTPDMEETNCGYNDSSFGMRFTYFGAYPVKSGDILIIGDEMIHGGEWHELLANPNVKNRGTNWGYGGISINAWIKAVEPILTANGNKEIPSEILLYTGVAPLYAKDADIPAIIDNYRQLIAKIREFAPADSTRIEIMSLIPRNEAELNDSLTLPFNIQLAGLASEDDNIGFIDIYTPLIGRDNAANPDFIENNFLMGRGYGVVARTLAPKIPGSKARCPKCIEDSYSKIRAVQP